MLTLSCYFEGFSVEEKRLVHKYLKDNQDKDTLSFWNMMAFYQHFYKEIEQINSQFMSKLKEKIADVLKNILLKYFKQILWSEYKDIRKYRKFINQSNYFHDDLSHVFVRLEEYEIFFNLKENLDKKNSLSAKVIEVIEADCSEYDEEEFEKDENYEKYLKIKRTLQGLFEFYQLKKFSYRYENFIKNYLKKRGKKKKPDTY